MKFIRPQAACSLALLSFCLLSACGSPSAGPEAGGPEILDSLAPPSEPTSGTDSVDLPEPAQTQILLLMAQDKQPSEALGIQKQLSESSLSFRAVTLTELNTLTQEEISKFRVIFWPGGLPSEQAKSLTPQTRERLRLAVLDNGVGFLGLGAGAWVAQSSPLGMGLVSERFSPFEHKRPGKSGGQVRITFQNGSTRTLSWREGPELGAWGDVIGRYPDGKTAIAAARVGKGQVLLSGPEPTNANLDLVVGWIKRVLEPSQP